MTEVLFGSLVKKPKIIKNYKAWGIGGGVAVVDANNDITPFIAKLSQIVDLTHYELVRASQVEHYESKHNRTPLLWLRFEKKDAEHVGVGCAHISATFDLRNGQLMGFVRMLPELDEVGSLTHQQALDTSLEFLREHAIDLVPSRQASPKLNKIETSERLGFSPYLNYDRVQFRWIGPHQEVLDRLGQPIIGMKVKMYIPESSLWCWVIVDKFNQVMAFERDISWAYWRMRRKTQMWLHDGWLAANWLI